MLTRVSRNVNLDNPANLAHPLLANRLAWWKVLRGGQFYGGPYLPDLIGVTKGNRTYRGTLTNGPLWKGQAGRGLGAIAFDGTNDFVNTGTGISTALTGITNFTVAIWVNTNTTANSGGGGGLRYLISTEDNAGHGWMIRYSPAGASNQFQFYSNDTGLDGPATFSSPVANKWYHVVGVADRVNTLLRLYVNGAAAGTASMSADASIGSNSLYLGAASFDNARAWSGLIDGASVYKVALSARQVAQLYEEELAGCPTTLNWLPTRTWFLGVSSGSPFILNLDPGSYAITGAATALKASRLLNLAVGAYSITGAAASLLASRKLNLAAGSYAISGAAAALLATRKLNLAAGAYSITGAAAGLRATRILNLASGSYAITGFAADLVKSGAAATYTLNLSPGSYSITGAAASLRATRVLNLAAGSYAITGFAAALTYTPIVPPVPPPPPPAISPTGDWTPPAASTGISWTPPAASGSDWTPQASGS